MTALADEVRELSGTTGKLGIDDMTSTLNTENNNLTTNISAQDDIIAQIQSALQGKTGGGGGEQATPVIVVDSNGLITATAGSKSSTKQLTTQAAKTITPNASSQTAVASGVYTTGAVTVAPIPAEYIIPSDEFAITANGTYDIKNYASVSVNIAGDSENLDTELNAQETKLNQLLSILDNKAAGGSTNPTASKKDVNFYDYDGTLLYSYTVEEAQSLTELPPLPNQPGLICQGWNYDLEIIKSYNGAVNIGATYITNDGKTRLYIKIAAEGRMTVPLYFSQTVAKGVTIDWGDGSSTETLTGTGNKNTSHTYSSIGDYVISLEVTSGTLGLGHNSSSYCIMGSLNSYPFSVRPYCNMIQKVEIGNSITSISAYTFYNCHSLASIAIPNNVTSIGAYAFHYCCPLASIVIPKGVVSIGDQAFSYCHSLANIIISNSVTSVGDTLFNSCHSITSIILPKSVASAYGILNGCAVLTNIVIPYGTTSIGGYAFSSCFSLTNINIPNSVTSIGANAFKSCIALASINIPNSVTSIGAYAFAYCYALTSITIPNSVISIGSYAFSNCNGMAIYDFTSHTSVPTLSSVNAFEGIPSDCIIKVPAALYDEWIAATNWSTYASKIVAV